MVHWNLKNFYIIRGKPMEPERNSQTYSNPYDGIPCENCGQPYQPEEGKIRVCNTCRETFIKYPIPKKVIIPLIITLCIVALMMCFHFPDSINAGVYYERANQAMKEKRFIDAERLLEKAHSLIPHSPSIMSNLAICCHMNLHLDRELELLNEMYEKKMNYSDQKLADIVDQINIFFDIPEEFGLNFEQIMAMEEEQRLLTLQEYSKKFPDSLYIKYALANALYGKGQYDDSEALLKQVLQKIPEYIPVGTSLAAIERERGNFEASEKKLLEQLELNRQSTFVLSSFSRLELKRFNDKKSLEYMETAYALEPESIDVLIDLARSYYYNQMDQNLSKLMETIQNHPEAGDHQADIQELKDIIEGTVQWR